MRPRALLARSGAALALLVLLAACGPLRRTPPSEEVVVSFVNESLMQADLFAVTTSGAYRLGTVAGGRTEELAIPQSIVRGAGSVNFVARLFPRRNTVDSGPVSVRPGDRLTVRLPSTSNLLAVTPG